MTRRGIALVLAAFLPLAGRFGASAQTNTSSTSFQEVYDLIHQHATGLSDAELNRDAIQGLLTALAPRVSLVTNNASRDTSATGPVVGKSTIFEGDIAYLRIGNVTTGLANAVSSAYRQLSATNKVSGVVLDLRYTDGTDYEAAAATADLFNSKAKPLLNWNGHTISSHEKSDAISVPLAALVNHETAGASEALAAMLRLSGVGLILGSRTAGEAMITQDYPLKNGEQLRIASAPVTLGDGSGLSMQGIKPDIDVTVSLEQERAFYADSFLVLNKTNKANSQTNLERGTNEAGLEHVTFNEAELVREHRAGENRDEATAKRPPEPRVPVVSDPALARALDLLKGLAVVRGGHS